MPWISLFFLLTMLAGPVLAVAASPAPGDGVVLVLSLHPEPIIRTAGGRPVGGFRAPFGQLAVSDAPGFADRLYAAGALRVTSGDGFARLCGGTS